MTHATLADLFAWERDASHAVVTAAAATPNLDARAWQIVGHLTATPLVWLARITGDQPPAIWQHTTSADAAVCLSRVEQAAEEYAALIGETDLDRIVHYVSTSGKRHATPLLGILLHVVTHGAYHRGQINQSIRGAGGGPVAQDYIYRVR